ncbi:hypothetical protein N5K55_03040 (plasmid) [Pseudomonas aeruginosa]|nr:hypothetical protein [Pseudomonas aeruginosa]
MQQQIIIQPEGSELIYEVLVSHDGGTVWVNCSDGNSVGRFSKHAGIDLHRTIAEQMAGRANAWTALMSRPGPKNGSDSVAG